MAQDTITLKLNKSYPSVATARAALLGEIGRLALVAFDPGAVPGDLLVVFDDHWPDGLCWDGEPEWGEDGPNPEAIYDIRDIEMAWDSGGGGMLEEIVDNFLKVNRGRLFPIEDDGRGTGTTVADATGTSTMTLTSGTWGEADEADAADEDGLDPEVK